MAFQSFGGRFAVPCLCLVLVAAAGCGGPAASGDLDKVGIAISRFDVTVTNTSGRALMEMRVEILPVGRATAYTARVPRLENGQKAELSFARFSDRSAIQFSPRTAKPQAVAVTANDVDGTEIHVEVPWTQK